MRLNSSIFAGKFQTSRRAARAAVTLLEVMIAAAMIGVAASSALWALTTMNRNANLARLSTGASTAAQNQIELILVDSPFNPQKNQIPPELQVGTSAPSTVTIYQDPSGTVITGTLTTEVADISPTLNSVTLPMYRATVTVAYTYGKRNYSVTLSTVRCSDI